MKNINFDKQKDDTPLTRGFSIWLNDELRYLKKFKNKTITISELFDYYQHGAYIDKELIDKILAKKIKSATTSYFEKLPKSLLRKILLAVGVPASAIFFFTGGAALSVICSFLQIITMPIALYYSVAVNGYSLIKTLAQESKDFFNVTFLGPIRYAKHHVTETAKSIKSIGKEEFDKSFIQELKNNNKIKIDSSASATLFSLTEKTTEKINKLEAELKKLEISEEPKKEHGTNKVNYMRKVLDKLKKEEE